MTNPLTYTGFKQPKGPLSAQLPIATALPFQEGCHNQHQQHCIIKGVFTWFKQCHIRSSCHSRSTAAPSERVRTPYGAQKLIPLGLCRVRCLRTSCVHSCWLWGLFHRRLPGRRTFSMPGSIYISLDENSTGSSLTLNLTEQTSRVSVKARQDESVQ